MDDSMLQALRTTNDPAEKAALVAEFVFDDLPGKAALVARRCVILHWFDQFIIETLLQDTLLVEGESRAVYEQLISLPFIEKLTWGFAFQASTREGLLKRYALTQPELLVTAARLAAPIYEVWEDDEKILAEALFCYIVAGDSSSSVTWLNRLLEEALSREDWQYMENLLLLQEEAEQLPFVEPVPRTERYWLLRGIVYRVQGKLDAAIADYSNAIGINPKSVLAHLCRGTVYAEQQHYEQAQGDYSLAIQIDPNTIQAYINRGITFIRQEKYREAEGDFTRALQLDPGSTEANKGKNVALDGTRRNEQALKTLDRYLHNTWPENQIALQASTDLRGDIHNAYWSEKQIAFTFEVPPSSANITSLNLQDLNEFLNDNGFNIKPFSYTAPPSRTQRSLSQMHFRDNEPIDDDLNGSIGKYMFGSAPPFGLSDGSTTIAGFFLFENLNGGKVGGASTTTEIASSVEADDDDMLNPVPQLVNLVNRNLEKLQQGTLENLRNGKELRPIPIVAASPNWLCRATSIVKGSPLTPPFPVPADLSCPSGPLLCQSCLLISS
jgi:tetratricopeptide (TPR) repeat protein